ncbi:sel1 repeat family protein [Ramlibacter sp. USB13]|uniref:Sel1 repeat family protein n=1 Tax=Ramlibacter cellulosilyticus TaxID=2764187 RepID=A0A923MTV3_9BURK|nr:sel1 repeat family protein [Ramlibacter cellulosilyticus]MBC5785300.1 sel1 repeat family protein [Ramlibacter cellulosilyticus]
MHPRTICAAFAFAAAQAFAQPAAEPPAAAASGEQPAAPAPEPTWSELLAANRHAELDAQIGAALEASLTDLARYRATQKALGALEYAPPQTSERFDAWVAATGSGIAHLVRGDFHLHRAQVKRGTEFIANTHPDAIARMRQLLPKARSDYEAALARLGPRCDACYGGLLAVGLLEGRRATATSLIDTAIQALDGGIATPLAYLDYLKPQWGGAPGEAQRFVDRFAADNPNRPAIPVLRSVLLVGRSWDLHQQHRYDQALLLAQQAATLDPGHAKAWERVAGEALMLKQYPLVLEATDHALAVNPQLGPALNYRASALLQGPTPLEAVPFLERAVAKGDEWALKALLPIVAAGQYGFQPDRERAEKICRSAIDALMPAGFACMGGLEYFGIGRKADRAKARQWFLEAADRGVEVAMVDAAKMLLAGDGGPRDEARAIALLREAHQRGEPRAEPMLRGELSPVAYVQHVQWPDARQRIRDSLQDHRAQTRAMLYVACLMLGSAFWGFMYRAGDKPAQRLAGQYHLRAGWLLRLLVLVNLAVVGAGLFFARFLAPSQQVWGYAALGLFLLAALYLVYAAFCTRTWFDDRALHFDSPLGGRKTIRFDRIAEVGWSWVAQCDYVESADGVRIYVSQMLHGCAELYQRIEAEQGESVTQPLA